MGRSPCGCNTHTAHEYKHGASMGVIAMAPLPAFFSFSTAARVLRARLQRCLVVLKRKVLIAVLHVTFAKAVIGIEALRKHLNVALENLDRVLYPGRATPRHKARTNRDGLPQPRSRGLAPGYTLPLNARAHAVRSSQPWCRFAGNRHMISVI